MFICYSNRNSSWRILAWTRLPILAFFNHHVTHSCNTFVCSELLNLLHKGSILNDVILVFLVLCMTFVLGFDEFIC